MFFQGIQDGWSIAILISAVKGEVDDLLVRILSVVGMVRLQFSYGSVPNRTLSFFLKTESPVGGFWLQDRRSGNAGSGMGGQTARSKTEAEKKNQKKLA